MGYSDSDFYKMAVSSIFRDLEGEVLLCGIKSFLSESMPVSAMTLAVYDEEKNAMCVIASVRPDTWPKLKSCYLYPAEIKIAMRELLDTLEPITVVNDITGLTRGIQKASLYLMPKDASFILMTLVFQGKRLGSLLILADGKNRFTQEHVRKMSLLYEPFTLAMTYILHHREVQDLRGKLETESLLLRRRELALPPFKIIGEDFGLKFVMEQVRQVAPLSSSVLLVGETGAGKEVIANAIHQYSLRSNKPFIRVNCGAIPEGLVDSELFGHEKGAFTGAVSQRKGRFERAHGGTLFLDEIGELPMAAQIRLLRVLQTNEFERVGSSETITVDVRIIVATHRDLEAMTRDGTFREDLFFRLNVFPIRIPPLRERLSDIHALVSYFIGKKTRELKISGSFQPAPGAIEEMMLYRWPGNVRELENVVERELIRSSSVEGERYIYFGKMTPGRFQKQGLALDQTIQPLDLVVARHIKQALIKAQGKIEGADGVAAMLGLNPSTLRSRMRKLGIRFGRK